MVSTRFEGQLRGRTNFMRTKRLRIHDVNLTSHTRSQALNDIYKRGVVVQFMCPDEVGSMSPRLHASTQKETFIFAASCLHTEIDHVHFHFHFLRKTPTPRRSLTKKRSGTRERTRSIFKSNEAPCCEICQGVSVFFALRRHSATLLDRV